MRRRPSLRASLRIRPLVLLAAVADALVERFVPIGPVVFDADGAAEWARSVEDATVTVAGGEVGRVA